MKVKEGEKIERKAFKTTHTELKVERKIAKTLGFNEFLKTVYFYRRIFNV